MGYTTSFEGQFDFDKLPTAELLQKMNLLEKNYGELDDTWPPGYPDRGYCQWELTKDWMGLHWNGGEKFYEYVEWANYLIEKLFKPAGVSMTGNVKYSGEATDDCGVLVIENGIVVQKQFSAMAEAAEDLKGFYEFVLASEYGDELLARWTRRKFEEASR